LHDVHHNFSETEKTHLEELIEKDYEMNELQLRVAELEEELELARDKEVVVVDSDFKPLK